MKCYIIDFENVEPIFSAENKQKAIAKVISEIKLTEKDMVEKETGIKYTAQELIDMSNYDKKELKAEKKKVKKYKIELKPVK